MKNKTKLFAALSAFQVMTSVASASQIKTVIIAENAELRVMCDVKALDRKAAQDWPGMVMDEEFKGKRKEAIIKLIDNNFAGGDYFDEYPHKLPEIFKAGGCEITKK